jgi:aminoglycoside phosphotransferase (APT) family kinase protein
LSALGIPDSLGHLDLNPWNIVVGREGCAFLDWAEAYVGHPFYSFQYLLEHFRRAVSLDRSREAHLTESYAEPWRHVVCGEAVGEALKLAPVLAAFAYAAGTGVWDDGENLRDPATAAFLRSLARRLNREAIEIDRIDSLD